MDDFMIRFLISNVGISVVIAGLFAVKGLLKNSLTSRIQYQIWFLLLALLVVPFLPLRSMHVPQLFSWGGGWTGRQIQDTSAVINGNASLAAPSDWLNDFAVSVSREAPSVAWQFLFRIWIAGILVMLALAVKAQLRLHRLKKSALPLQNQEIRGLYERCLLEMDITKNIPVYSTAFLKSPVIVGFLKPCIYLPIHLISDYHAADLETCGRNTGDCMAGGSISSGMNATDCMADGSISSGMNAADIRFMLLHELQHYKHRDALVNDLMNLAGIFYWFNPLVWYALKEMRGDRETACDSSVLNMLDEKDYEAYGHTLINFAEKVSLTPFSFSTGIGSNMKQMKKRILNIAYYEKPSVRKRFRSVTVFILTAALLSGIAPTLSAYAEDDSHYQWNVSSENISYIDLSSYFGDYEGSFVLYDPGKGSWNIYHPENAVRRTSPNSTYKVYDALFGLEEGVITPEDSFMAWDRQTYSYDAWNADQDLRSAMSASVNWYFQEIDRQLGAASISRYLQEIGYGNEDMGKETTDYWLESSLKISPVEQVELLTKLYKNEFGFSQENIDAVKDSLRISSSDAGTLYGKTGTGQVNEQDVNGWFIGYMESAGNTSFFAVNITGKAGATGSRASEIALAILSDIGS